MWVAQVPALSSTLGAAFWLSKLLSRRLRTASRPLLAAVPTMPAAKPTTANTSPCTMHHVRCVVLGVLQGLVSILLLSNLCFSQEERRQIVLSRTRSLLESAHLVAKIDQTVGDSERSTLKHVPACITHLCYTTDMREARIIGDKDK